MFRCRTFRTIFRRRPFSRPYGLKPHQPFGRLFWARRSGCHCLPSDRLFLAWHFRERRYRALRQLLLLLLVVLVVMLRRHRRQMGPTSRMSAYPYPTPGSASIVAAVEGQCCRCCGRPPVQLLRLGSSSTRVLRVGERARG